MRISTGYWKSLTPKQNRHSLRKWILLSILCFLWSGISAQVNIFNPTEIPPPNPPSTQPLLDSLPPANPPKASSTIEDSGSLNQDQNPTEKLDGADITSETDNKTEKPSESKPVNAVKRSALVPGWGQLSNRQIWKSPIAMGLFAGGLAFSIDRGRQTHQFAKALDVRTNGKANDALQFASGISTKSLIDQYFKSRSQSDWSIVGTAWIYLMNITDALVFQQNPEQLKTHNPLKAAYFASLFPGAGQIYNRKYWKLPIVYGAIGLSSYFVISNTNEFRRFRKANILRHDDDPNTLDEFEDQLSDNGLQSFEDFYSRNLDFSFIALIATYLLSIVDATVDAHLYDFNIDDNLSFEIRPTFVPSPTSRVAGMSLALKLR